MSTVFKQPLGQSKVASSNVTAGTANHPTAVKQPSVGRANPASQGKSPIVPRQGDVLSGYRAALKSGNLGGKGWGGPY